MITKTRLKTYKYADVSTGHVTKNDAALLNADSVARSGRSVSSWPALIVFGYKEGFFVHVPEDKETFDAATKCATAAGYSKELVELLLLTRKEGASFLRLDCDGEPYDGLPKFDW